MNKTIPEEIKITTLLHQNTYLVNGELKKWNKETMEVYSTISSTENWICHNPASIADQFL